MRLQPDKARGFIQLPSAALAPDRQQASPSLGNWLRSAFLGQQHFFVYLLLLVIQ
jgi:hypothetical protein